MNPNVSIIILIYNAKKYVKTCINSVLKSSYKNFEIIILDNNSPDGSLNYCKKLYPKQIWSGKIKIIPCKKNYGFAEGNNIGIKYARGKYIVFLNPDTFVDKNWLFYLVEAAKKNPKVAICGSKVLNLDKKTIQFAGGEIDFFLSPTMIGLGKKDSKQFDEQGETGRINGASFLLKKDILNHLKYCFDKSYFIYYEEIDLCWRIRLLGYKILYVPSSKCYHRTYEVLPERFLLLNIRNKFLSCRKNFSFPLKEFFVLLLLIRNTATFFYWISRKKIRHFSGFFKIFSGIFYPINYDLDIEKIPLSKQLSILSPPSFERYKDLFKRA
jgi:GT2 family glycosyltransferase